MSLQARRRRAAMAMTAAALALAAARPGTALPLAMTKEGVQKKAVIIGHDAKLFAKAAGDAGKKAEFMQIYFLLEGEAGDRVPVTNEPDKADPDGWLKRGSFAEWNTLQMINFEPQSGRELARIFPDAGCAEKFGQAGEPGPCKELGSEPQRVGQQKDNYSLLIPVLERNRDNYRGGFVRVSDEGPVVKPQTDAEMGIVKGGTNRLGYDLVMVVDSTASMQEWFEPTTRALDTFISSVRQQIGSGELKTPFRVGLLFYRDRKLAADCDIGYLFRWESELTNDITAVSRALAASKEAECGSDERPESVYDALSRAVQDPKWNDGHFKVVLLVGDAPPHPPGFKEKNPLGLDLDAITKMSEERNIRFMAFKIGLGDEAEFKALAHDVKAAVQGRFRAIEPTNKTAYQNALLSALQEEWGLLTAGNQAFARGITQQAAQRDPTVFQKKGIDVSQYEMPIIIANLPPGSASLGAPEFVEGWVPKKIKQKLTMGEYIFMNKLTLGLFINAIDSIALAAQQGTTEGGEAFITTLRSSLATQLKAQPDDLFRSGESLDSMMAKARILPFKTTVLSFTAEEVNAWKPADFERLNKILAEKTAALREYSQKPGNTRMFGNKAHLYVPRDLFP